MGLYRLYNKEVGAKYKNKYRSMVFNIKDEKNSGLFRKIATSKIGPKELVAINPEDMANKELQQWRQKELKSDIEKIKSHELDMIKLGSKFVMKSHKGEVVIENEDGLPTPKRDVFKLPEEVELPAAEEKSGVFENPVTWEHGTHDFEPLCDVCTNKKTLDEFLLIKIEKENRDKARKKEKDKEKKDKKSSSSSHRRP